MTTAKWPHGGGGASAPTLPIPDHFFAHHAPPSEALEPHSASNSASTTPTNTGRPPWLSLAWKDARRMVSRGLLDAASDAIRSRPPVTGVIISPNASMHVANNHAAGAAAQQASAAAALASRFVSRFMAQVDDTAVPSGPPIAVSVPAGSIGGGGGGAHHVSYAFASIGAPAGLPPPVTPIATTTSASSTPVSTMAGSSSTLAPPVTTTAVPSSQHPHPTANANSNTTTYLPATALPAFARRRLAAISFIEAVVQQATGASSGGVGPQAGMYTNAMDGGGSAAVGGGATSSNQSTSGTPLAVANVPTTSIPRLVLDRADTPPSTVARSTTSAATAGVAASSMTGGATVPPQMGSETVSTVTHAPSLHALTNPVVDVQSLFSPSLLALIGAVGGAPNAAHMAGMPILQLSPQHSGGNVKTGSKGAPPPTSSSPSSSYPPSASAVASKQPPAPTGFGVPAALNLGPTLSLSLPLPATPVSSDLDALPRDTSFESPLPAALPTNAAAAASSPDGITTGGTTEAIHVGGVMFSAASPPISNFQMHSAAAVTAMATMLVETLELLGRMCSFSDGVGSTLTRLKSGAATNGIGIPNPAFPTASSASGGHQTFASSVVPFSRMASQAQPFVPTVVLTEADDDTASRVTFGGQPGHSRRESSVFGGGGGGWTLPWNSDGGGAIRRASVMSAGAASSAQMMSSSTNMFFGGGPFGAFGGESATVTASGQDATAVAGATPSNNFGKSFGSASVPPPAGSVTGILTSPSAAAATGAGGSGAPQGRQHRSVSFAFFASEAPPAPAPPDDSASSGAASETAPKDEDTPNAPSHHDEAADSKTTSSAAVDTPPQRPEGGHTAAAEKEEGFHRRAPQQSPMAAELGSPPVVVTAAAASPVDSPVKGSPTSPSGAPAAARFVPPPAPHPGATAIIGAVEPPSAVGAAVAAWTSSGSPNHGMLATGQAVPVSVSPAPRRASIAAQMRFDRRESVMSSSSRAEVQASSNAVIGWLDPADGSCYVNQYLLVNPIGEGAQGQVYLVYDSAHDEMRAMKIIKRPVLADAVSNSRSHLKLIRKNQQLAREIAIMKRCRHRNVVALYEVIDDPEADRVYLIMQYVEKGPLMRLAQNGIADRIMTPADVALYGRQLCAGLCYLHEHNVVHRDIKPDNILLGEGNNIYLADFGVSELFSPDDDGSIEGHRGTKAFLAPELLRAAPNSARTADGKAVDVWALGVTFYTMLVGRLPWQCVSAETYIAAACSRPPEYPTVFPDGSAAPQVPGAWRRILAGMLQIDPRERWSTERVRREVKSLHEQLCRGANEVADDEVLEAVTTVRRKSVVNIVPAPPQSVPPQVGGSSFRMLQQVHAGGGSSTTASFTHSPMPQHVAPSGVTIVDNAVPAAAAPVILPPALPAIPEPN